MSEQRSELWFKERLGCVSSSCIADVLARPKKGSGEASTRRNLKARLVTELLTGKHDDGYTNWEMERGIRLEPLAVVEYELHTGFDMESVGFVPHPKIKRAGASPDRLIGDDGLLETKCPNMANHYDYLMDGIVPVQYRKQMFWEMACTGRQWADFVSYHPSLPAHLQLFVARLKRDAVEIGEIEAEVIKFNAEIDEILLKLPKGETVCTA